MALTPLDIVARAHHRQQAKEAMAAVTSVRREFAGVDLRDRRQVTAAVDRATPTLLQQRAASIRRARTFYNESLLLARVRASRGLPVVEDDDTAEDRIRTSLYVTSRGRLAKRADEESYERAAQKNRAEVERATVRHTLDGGRSQIVGLVKADDRVKGFVRVTSQDARVCAFCAMLASREDYKATSFKASDIRFKMGGNPLANAKVHDGCRCSLRPVFYGEATPDHTLRARELWYELSEGDGREAYLSFRRKYEGLLRAGAETVWQAA